MRGHTVRSESTHMPFGHLPQIQIGALTMERGNYSNNFKRNNARTPFYSQYILNSYKYNLITVNCVYKSLSSWRTNKIQIRFFKKALADRNIDYCLLFLAAKFATRTHKKCDERKVNCWKNMKRTLHRRPH